MAVLKFGIHTIAHRRALEPIVGLRWAPVFDGFVRLGFLPSVLGIVPMQVGPGPWPGLLLWLAALGCRRKPVG